MKASQPLRTPPEAIAEFRWTGAVRPAPGAVARYCEGYRYETFRDVEEKLSIPMLTAMVSAERLFDVFLDLMGPLGPVVQVVLETSHGNRTDRHCDLRRDGIDTAVLASYLCEFEELLLNDGCTGVAILAENRPIELQFDEHKQLSLYGPDLKPFRRVLHRHGIGSLPEMVLVSEDEHFHYSEPDHPNQFEQLALRLGVGEFSSVFSDDQFGFGSSWS